MAIAAVKYFHGRQLLLHPYAIHDKTFAEKFPGVKGRRCDSFTKWVGKDAAGELRPVDRIIEYKRNPSLHKCDGRCLHAKGRQCECSCGGANHGAG